MIFFQPSSWIESEDQTYVFSENEQIWVPTDVKLHAAFKRHVRHEYMKKIKKDGALVTGL